MLGRRSICGPRKLRGGGKEEEKDTIFGFALTDFSSVCVRQKDVGGKKKNLIFGEKNDLFLERIRRRGVIISRPRGETEANSIFLRFEF